jgi:hypothetical protein
MNRWVLRLCLSLFAISHVSAMAAQPVRAANFQSENPVQGKVVDGTYVNTYFGLRYTLPTGWQAGLQPAPPSVGGYYVLLTPKPPPDAHATILIAAQDTFFAKPPVADAEEMTRGLARNFTIGGKNTAAISGAANIAGHSFLRVDWAGAPLSHIVLATDIRCHVVIFTFTGVGAGSLKQLVQSLSHLSLEQIPSAPDCVKDYAAGKTVLHKVAPAPAGPEFVKVPVRIIIGADGRVEHIHVIRASAAQRKSIRDALPEWRFVPYLRSGKPSPVETGLTFAFKSAGGPN